LVDLDGDGLTDLISGSWPGEIYWFRRQKDGTFAAAKTLRDKDDEAINPGSASAVFAFDWDSDGKFDLIAGTIDGTVWLLKNIGEKSKPIFAEPNQLLAEGKPINVGGDTAPVVADWDSDGKPDLIVGADDGSVVWFRNIGTAKNPKLASPRTLVPASTGARDSHRELGPNDCGMRAKPCVVDWDGDGKLDLLLGDVGGSFKSKPAQTPQEKAEEARTKARLPQLRKEWAAAYQAFSAASDAPEPSEPKARELQQRKTADLRARVARLKDEIARAEDAREKYQSSQMSHGYVWLFLRK
jgi:hypothetical protein